MPFLFVMCVANLCKMKVPKVVQAIFGCICAVILILVSTIGTWNGYYKSVDFVMVEGHGMLIKEYGSLHILYPVYIVITFLVAVFYIVKAMQNKKEVPFSTSILLVITMTLSMIGYFGNRMIGLGLEITPFVYDITLVLIFILLRRISLLNIVTITGGTMYESDIYGFIVFDNKGEYLGSDRAAKKWFPQIKDVHVGKKLTLDNEILDGLVRDMLAAQKPHISCQITAGQFELEAVGTSVKRNLAEPVYCIYLRDDTTQQELNRLNARYQEDLEREVEEKTETIKNIQDDIVISMASIVENRDGNTGGHIARTSDVVKVFVNYLKTKPDSVDISDHLAKRIIKAAPLHDFGKIAIPDMILNKPGRFEPEEYEIMKMHSAKGAVIVARILQNSDDDEFHEIAVNVAHYHHEKWDGTGYPDRLKEEKIPFEARVMALADVFDALVSKRVYKDRMSYDKAFSIIEESCGTQFDPELGRLFLECKDQLIELYDSYED